MSHLYSTGRDKLNKDEDDLVNEQVQEGYEVKAARNVDAAKEFEEEALEFVVGGAPCPMIRIHSSVDDPRSRILVEHIVKDILLVVLDRGIVNSPDIGQQCHCDVRDDCEVNVRATNQHQCVHYLVHECGQHLADTNIKSSVLIIKSRRMVAHILHDSHRVIEVREDEEMHRYRC